LVGRFRSENIPATGFSIGVSRLFAALKLVGSPIVSAHPATGPVVVLVLDRERLADYQQMVAQLREAGVASVSAPVRGPNGKVIAAVSISGPIERLGRQPGRVHAAAVVATAARLTEHLAKS
jgi:histidyl-tRNA synthetase